MNIKYNNLLSKLKPSSLITPEIIDSIILIIKEEKLKNNELTEFLEKIYTLFKNSNENVEAKGFLIKDFLFKLNKIKIDSTLHNKFKNLMLESNQKIKFRCFKSEIKITHDEKKELIEPFIDLDFKRAIFLYMKIFFKQIKIIRTQKFSEELIPYLGEIDEHGNIIKKNRNIKKRLVFLSIYLNYILEILIEKSNDMLLFHQMINESTLLTFTDKNVFKRSFNCYKNQQYIEFLHLSVPRIENLFRNIINKNIENGNSSLLGEKRNYGFDYKLLSKLLDDPIIKNIFSEDCIFVFKFILVDSNGFNLRNRLSHGLVEINETSEEIAILTMSLLIFLIDLE